MQRFELRRYAPWALVVLCSAVLWAVYLKTLAPGLTWANYGVDGGDLIAAAATLGIPHPPGYPTYVLLARLFLLLPTGDLAYRAALLSASAAALAGGLFSALVAMVMRGNPAARAAVGLAAGLSIGLAPIPWSQAVIAEVHALNLLFVVLALWLMWMLNGREGRLRWAAVALAFAFGLGMGNHVTLALVIPPMVILVWRRWRRNPSDHVHLRWMILAFILGLAVYIYLPLRARAQPPINWGNPSTVSGFLWTITARPYQGLAFALPVDQITERIGAWAGLLVEAFGYAGLTFGVIGLVYGRSKSRGLDLAVVWIMLAYSIFALGYNTADSTGYLIPAHLGFAWLFALGMSAIIDAMETQFDQRMRRLWPLVPLIAFLGIAWQAPRIARQVNASRDYRAMEYGQSVMEKAPRRAVILTWEAIDAFPLWYYHFALGQRPDLAIIVVPLTQFQWYRDQLAVLYPDLPLPGDEILQLEGEQRITPPEYWKRPVCFSEIIAREEGQVLIFCPSGQIGDGTAQTGNE